MSINVFMTPVKGVTFEGRQSLIAAMRTGDRVSFRAEIDNKYDRKAIAVINDHGDVLGYIAKYDERRQPNEMRERIRRALDCGFVYAQATKVGGFVKSDGSRASLGLRVKWCCVPANFKCEDKPEDDEPVIRYKRKNGKQAQKEYRPDYRDDMRHLKKKHKGRFSYQEIQTMKERRAG